MAEDDHPAAVERREAGEDGLVVGEEPVAVQLDDVGEEGEEVVVELRDGRGDG